jgi:CO dehydrogenase nickel-insertion accessory protein CooC1
MLQLHGAQLIHRFISSKFENRVKKVHASSQIVFVVVKMLFKFLLLAINCVEFVKEIFIKKIVTIINVTRDSSAIFIFIDTNFV